jgi:hypothetical protein
VKKIQAQLIIPDSINFEEVEVNLLDLQLGTLEMDRKIVSNVREKTAVLLRIIDGNSIVTYSDTPRTKHEINGAYKIALNRCEQIATTKVYNLYFKFKSFDGWLDGTGIALMWRPPEILEEWIMLLPDDTSKRIATEKRMLLDEARSLAFSLLMNSDDHSILIENLNLLTIHERCAQSLMHEVGHVLHWREFDEKGITARDLSEQYKWFVESGYLYNVNKRCPLFDKKSALDKVVLLKESLVEDYRISLNIEATRGKFILPNKICFSGDFQKPKLLEEGIEIMKNMLKNVAVQSRRKSASSSDLDSIQIIREIRRVRRQSKWVAGKITVTENDIMRDLEELSHFSLREVAASRVN